MYNSNRVNCNRCNIGHCKKIGSHWNKFPWPEGRSKGGNTNNCYGMVPIASGGLATLFDVAFYNNPKGVYDMLSQTHTKLSKQWTYQDTKRKS